MYHLNKREELKKVEEIVRQHCLGKTCHELKQLTAETLDIFSRALQCSQGWMHRLGALTRKSNHFNDCLFSPAKYPISFCCFDSGRRPPCRRDGEITSRQLESPTDFLPWQITTAWENVNKSRSWAQEANTIRCYFRCDANQAKVIQVERPNLWKELSEMLQLLWLAGTAGDTSKNYQPLLLHFFMLSRVNVP